MNKGLEALEVAKQLKEFVLKFIKNDLDRRFVIGSFNILEKELKAYEQTKGIEEDLGIDLATAVNGAYNGIYYIHPSKENSDMKIMKGYIDLSSVDKMEHSFILNNSCCCLSFLDYGKKRLGGWALTKEELL